MAWNLNLDEQHHTQDEAAMRLNRSIGLVTLCLGGVQAAAAQEPPTSEEAQAAYSRFATAVVGRLIAAGLPTTLSGGKFAEINEFAHRQPLRGCDERREPDRDPLRRRMPRRHRWCSTAPGSPASGSA